MCNRRGRREERRLRKGLREQGRWFNPPPLSGFFFRRLLPQTSDNARDVVGWRNRRAVETRRQVRAVRTVLNRHTMTRMVVARTWGWCAGAPRGVGGSRARRAWRTCYSTQTDPYTDRVEKARFDCTAALGRADPSSVLLSKMYPAYLRDSFVAFRALNMELSKVSFGFQPGATAKSREFSNLKFAFWLQQVEACETLTLENAGAVLPRVNEPCTVLLADTVLRHLRLDAGMLKQMVHSHQHFYNHNSAAGFRSLDDVCSFGEGTFSQMNYLMQSVLLSPQLSGFADPGVALLELPGSDDLRHGLTDISAHLGQATAVGSFLVGLRYFAEKKHTLMLPTDTLTKHRLSEEACLRYLQGRAADADPDTKERLKNVVFDMATRANDHLISARTKLDLVKTHVQQLAAAPDTPAPVRSLLRHQKRGLPDCLFLPYLSGLPTTLYLERLEKYDFDLLHPNLMYKEWRLAFRLWNAERTRSL